MAGNRFSVQPADLSPIMGGIGSIVKQNREAQRKKQTEEGFMEAYRSGDPDKVAEFSIKNPEFSKIMDKRLGFRDQKTKDNFVTTTMRSLSDPANTLTYMQNRVDYLKSVNGDPTQTLQAMEVYKRDPEGAKKMQELSLAQNAPKMYEAYKEQKYGFGEKGNRLKQFQPITIQNKQTGEKRLVMPTGNPKTGEATLNPLDLPEGFEVSTETTEEKRAADVLAKGDIRAETIRRGGKEKRQQALIAKGQDAADSYANIKRGIELLGEIETGGIDRVSIAAKQFFGVEGADEAELSNRLSKAVLSQLRETFGAAFTESEGRRLERIEAGFGKSTAGNKRLLRQAERIILRSARRGIHAAKSSGDMETAMEIQDALDFSLSDPDQPQAPPPFNSQGWGLQQDANGNKAYVGPNGEIEEVQ